MKNTEDWSSELAMDFRWPLSGGIDEERRQIISLMKNFQQRVNLVGMLFLNDFLLKIVIGIHGIQHVCLQYLQSL